MKAFTFLISKETLKQGWDLHVVRPRLDFPNESAQSTFFQILLYLPSHVVGIRMGQSFILQFVGLATEDRLVLIYTMQHVNHDFNLKTHRSATQYPSVLCTAAGIASARRINAPSCI